MGGNTSYLADSDAWRVLVLAAWRLCRRLAAAMCLSCVAIAAHGATQSAGQGAPPTAPVPVATARAERRQVPVYANGLGTVQAWRTVTAKAQVNGYLDRIAFREGQDVHAGDLLAMIDPRPYAALLAQADAKRAADMATLANDQLNFQRDSALARDSYATRQQADNDQALVRETQATIQGDAAAIAQAQLNLDFCRITAPIDGVVGYRLVDVGNLIEASAQTPIVTIQQIQPIAVVFTLPEQQFSAVQQAQGQQRQGAGTLPVLAYTADAKTQLDQGTLVTPNNSIDSTTGTISLKAIFANPQRRLWPGQYVQARLQIGVQQDSVTVPVQAIQHGPDGLYVFLVGADGKVAQRPVAIGYQTDSLAVVTQGLNGGETIVTDGQSRLQSGTLVTQSAKPPAKS